MSDRRPSDYAAEAAAEIMKTCKAGMDPATEDLVRNIARSLVRQTIEHCAMVAEDYTANEDPDELMSGDQVCIEIAAELRSIADERRLSYYECRKSHD